MQIKDVIGFPLQHLDPYPTLWLLYIIFTIIPGTLLWMTSLGVFRYWNVTGKVCSYLANKSIEHDLRNRH